MEKQHPVAKENQKQYSHHKRHKHKHYKKDFSKKESVPVWDMESTSNSIQLNETKADLMMILEDVNPEELLMTSLVQQSKEKKLAAFKSSQEDQPKTDDKEIISEETSETSETSEISETETRKVKINISQTCPICEKPIREIMYALHDYEHDQLAHFDCVYKKVLKSVQEKLINKRYLAYLGSGSFGIMEPASDKQPITLIEKIYPGAPLEELLHADEQQNNMDEEL